MNEMIGITILILVNGIGLFLMGGIYVGIIKPQISMRRPIIAIVSIVLYAMTTVILKNILAPHHGSGYAVDLDFAGMLYAVHLVTLVISVVSFSVGILVGKIVKRYTSRLFCW